MYVFVLVIGRGTSGKAITSMKKSRCPVAVVLVGKNNNLGTYTQIEIEDRAAAALLGQASNRIWHCTALATALLRVLRVPSAKLLVA